MTSEPEASPEDGPFETASRADIVEKYLQRRKRPARRVAQVAPLDTNRILQEAARLFLERGYEQTRMQDIAAAFGVTHAALYYYFPRKSDILVSLNLKALETLLAGASDANSQSKEPAERFQLQLAAHVRFVACNLPLIGCYFHYDASIEPEDLSVIRNLRRQYTDMLVTSFAEAQAAGRFDTTLPPRTAVNVLIGAANWMCQWLTIDDESEADRLTEQVMQLLASGFVGGPLPVSLPESGQASKTPASRRRRPT